MAADMSHTTGLYLLYHDNIPPQHSHPTHPPALPLQAKQPSHRPLCFAPSCTCNKSGSGKQGCGCLRRRQGWHFRSCCSPYQRQLRIFEALANQMSNPIIRVWPSLHRRPCQESNCPRRYLRLQGSPGGPASRHMTSNQLLTTVLPAWGAPVALEKSSLRPLRRPKNANKG